MNNLVLLVILGLVMIAALYFSSKEEEVISGKIEKEARRIERFKYGYDDSCKLFHESLAEKSLMESSWVHPLHLHAMAFYIFAKVFYEERVK